MEFNYWLEGKGFVSREKVKELISDPNNKEDIPDKWAILLKDVTLTTYRVTIETELTFDMLAEEGTNNKSWGEMPMFGMWKDREDMSDPSPLY